MAYSEWTTRVHFIIFMIRINYEKPPGGNMRFQTIRKSITGLGITFLLAGTAFIHTGNTSDMASPKQHFDAFGIELETLRSHLKKSGLDADALFEHPSFAIDETIRERFEKSAEATSIDTYLEEADEDDPEQQERVFQKQFTRYKKRIGFNNKRRGISRFMKKYGDLLDASEKEYGIPAEVIAAIIGVESNYGAVTGKHYAFNVYVSMYVTGYRSDFALGQLEELLKFARKKDMDVFTVKSSYAGAMGYMQFIPYSLNHWFVGDDIYDMGDTISSVANYLSHFLERRGTIERAVFSYNPSKFYTATVLELAEYGKKHR